MTQRLAAGERGRLERLARYATRVVLAVGEQSVGEVLVPSAWRSNLPFHTEHNPGDRHGKTSELTEQELDDLVALLFSL